MKSQPDTVTNSSFLHEDEREFLDYIAKQTAKCTVSVVKVRVNVYVHLRDKLPEEQAINLEDTLNFIEDANLKISRWSTLNKRNRWLPSSVSEYNQAIELAYSINLALISFTQRYDVFIDTPEFKDVLNNQKELRRALIAITAMMTELERYRKKKFSV